MFLAKLPEDTVVLLRSGLNTPPGRFETDALELCGFLGLTTKLCQPRPTDANPGRASVFVRDFDMVAEADLVLTFIAADQDEYSGTAHLMDKAIELGKPIYAYEVTDGGAVTRYGEDDPEGKFADMVPLVGI